MQTPYRVDGGIHVLPSDVTIPGLGLITVNAFVLDGPEPVLVDTGLLTEQDAFMDALGTVIDPASIRWLWLTHTDPDHIGSLRRVLDVVPGLRVVTTFLGVGKLNLSWPVPMERMYLLNPGQTLDAGGRRLTALRPPTFDAPETTGFFEHGTRALFSSDCFGGVLAEPVQDADDVPPQMLAEGQILWSTVDAPWLGDVRQETYLATLGRVRSLGAEVVLSSHLPVARGMTDRLLDTLAAARTAIPFVGPDQAALEAMMVQAGVGVAAEPMPPPPA